MRELVSSRQVTTLITNHTFSDLVLRPPGIQVQGPTPDEPIYKALGDAMAAENGYASQNAYELYDTTGTTEDWSYFATGGLGFTFEIGPEHFHPPFAETVAEYDGSTRLGRQPRGVLHSRRRTPPTRRATPSSTGRAPAGAVLRLKKTFQTPTSQEHDVHRHARQHACRCRRAGAFEWHVNPSTRPLVAQERGREATGDPSPSQAFASRGGNGPVRELRRPAGDGCYEDHTITIPGGTGIDNARATIRVQWATPVSDYDMKVFRDGVEVGSSGQGTTDFEQVVLGDPGARASTSSGS